MVSARIRTNFWKLALASDKRSQKGQVIRLPHGRNVIKCENLRSIMLLAIDLLRIPVWFIIHHRLS